MLSRIQGFGLLEFLIALSLGALLCVGLFQSMDVLQQLYRRQLAIADLQEKMRFATLFLREKIQMAGDGSCEADQNIQDDAVIQKFTTDEAQEKLGLTIKPGTQLLQLHECIRYKNKLHYLPVNFFIMDTARVNAKNQPIDALFMKIQDHPREELITGMTDFQIKFYSPTEKKENVLAVKLKYLLSSVDNALHQPGVLYVARRNASSSI